MDPSGGEPQVTVWVVLPRGDQKLTSTGQKANNLDPGVGPRRHQAVQHSSLLHSHCRQKGFCCQASLLHLPGSCSDSRQCRQSSCSSSKLQCSSFDLKFQSQDLFAPQFQLPVTIAAHFLSGRIIIPHLCFGSIWGDQSQSAAAPGFCSSWWDQGQSSSSPVFYSHHTIPITSSLFFWSLALLSGLLCHRHLANPCVVLLWRIPSASSWDSSLQIPSASFRVPLSQIPSSSSREVLPRDPSSSYWIHFL